MLSDELRHKLILAIESNPQSSQRDLARDLGISLGKANYCMRALIRQGLVKASNFKNNNNRRAYMYMLTPSGIEEKSQLASKFLHLKMREFELLKHEIEQLREETNVDFVR